METFQIQEFVKIKSTVIYKVNSFFILLYIRGDFELWMFQKVYFSANRGNEQNFFIASSFKMIQGYAL